MATGGLVQYGQGTAAPSGPALGYGDGAPYSAIAYRNYNDHYDGGRASVSAPSPTKQKASNFDYGSLLYVPSTTWTWAFALTILFQLVVCLTLESIVFALFQDDLLPEAKNPNAADHAYAARTIPTYLSLLIFGFVYELILTYDALRTQNTIQIIGLVIMNSGILIYTAIQPEQIHDAFRNLLTYHFIPEDYWTKASPILTAIPCLVALFSVILGGLSWALYKEFGWKIYKQIGADRRMKNRYLLYQIYIAALKFDFFLFIGFAVQFLVIVQGTNDAEKDLTWAAIPLFVILLLLAAWSVRHENIPTTVISMIVYLVAFAYFLFKLVRMFHSSPQRLAQYAPARKTLTVFAVVTLIYLVITMVIATWCALNYNKGLKQHILRRNRSGSVATDGGSYEGKESSQYPLDPYPAPGSGGSGPGVGRLNGGTRMEID